MSNSIKEVRNFYNSVMEEWFAVEKAAAERSHYTVAESTWLRQHRQKVKEATDIYQIALFEGIHFESRVLKWLTVALIFLTGTLAMFTLPSFIEYLYLIGWLK